MQTLASVRATVANVAADRKHVVELEDGDAIVVHENDPAKSATEEAEQTLVLFHGLSGCHGSPYMIRLVRRFCQLGYRVCRVDMRGCGDARELAEGISHAGRSEDVGAALASIADRHGQTLLSAIGVSLGGNQLLRCCGRIGAGLESKPTWWSRMQKVAVVAPPIDLLRCSQNMSRWGRRLYNRYFIRALIRRAPNRLRDREAFRQVIADRMPTTLFELDDRLTAPLSGFGNANEYYAECGAGTVAGHNPLPTLVVAAEDDPIVPVDCFARKDWPDSTRVVISRGGGHAGYVGRGGQQWMDECLHRWLDW